MTTDGLVTRQAAAELLGVQEGEVDDAVKAGTLTEVYARSTPEASLEAFILGADVDHLLGGGNERMNAAIRAQASRGRRQPGETVNDHIRRRGAR